MRKIAAFLIFVLCIMACAFDASAEKPQVLFCYDFIGGGLGTLDKWRSDGANTPDGSKLITDARAYVGTALGNFEYRYDETLTDDESNKFPYIYIMPDDAPESGRWKLTAFTAYDLTAIQSVFSKEYMGEPTENPFMRLYSSRAESPVFGMNDQLHFLELRTGLALTDGLFGGFIANPDFVSQDETTNLFLLTRDAAGSVTLRQVKLGATDSGGTGYRALIVPNSN